MLRHAFLGLAVMLLAAPAYGQEVNIKWNFKEGDKFWMEDVTVQKQSVTVLGTPISTEQKTTTLTSYNVKKVAADSVVLVVTYEDIKANVEGGIGGDMDKLMEKMKGTSLTITMAPDGKVTKVEGVDALIKIMLADQDEMVKTLMKDMLTEETLVKGIEQAFAFVPEKGVKKGDTWTRVMTVPLGPMGTLKSINNYAYNGKVADGEDISFKQDIQYMLPRNEVAGMFKVTKGNLKSDNSAGSVVFDAARGRIVRSQSSMKIGGSLTIDVGGQEASMDLSMDVNTTSRLLDKPPEKK